MTSTDLSSSSSSTSSSNAPIFSVSECFFFFFFNDTATTEIYTLSLHDALPISPPPAASRSAAATPRHPGEPPPSAARSEEHTSELQSPCNLVCRLLLEKKKSQHGRHHRPPQETVGFLVRAPGLLTMSIVTDATS